MSQRSISSKPVNHKPNCNTLQASCTGCYFFLFFFFSSVCFPSSPNQTLSRSTVKSFWYTNLLNVTHRKLTAAEKNPKHRTETDGSTQTEAGSLGRTCKSTASTLTLVYAPTDDDDDDARDARCYLPKHQPIRSALDCITSSRLIAPNCALFCLAAVNLSRLLLFAFSSQW